MNPPKLYIFCGLPFSGKTILAKEILKKEVLVFVSIDDIKFAHGFTWSEDENISAEEWKKIFDESYQKSLEALKAGKSVLYDSANQSKVSRDKLREIAKEASAKTKVIFMNIPEKIVRERWADNKNSRKRFHLPERFFNAAFSNYEPPTPDENLIIFNLKDDVNEWVGENF
ncbi:MAG: ATP-binding protein [Patescibacteria group bacterium]